MLPPEAGALPPAPKHARKAAPKPKPPAANPPAAKPMSARAMQKGPKPLRVGRALRDDEPNDDEPRKRPKGKS